MNDHLFLKKFKNLIPHYNNVINNIGKFKNLKKGKNTNKIIEKNFTLKQNESSSNTQQNLVPILAYVK